MGFIAFILCWIWRERNVFVSLGFNNLLGRSNEATPPSEFTKSFSHSLDSFRNSMWVDCYGCSGFKYSCFPSLKSHDVENKNLSTRKQNTKTDASPWVWEFIQFSDSGFWKQERVALKCDWSFSRSLQILTCNELSELLPFSFPWNRFPTLCQLF